MKKTLAFTLAEVLVVMGIIGVVAAITIPTLNNTTNEKEIVAKVNKSAAMITDSYGRARAKYGRYRKDWQGKDVLCKPQKSALVVIQVAFQYHLNLIMVLKI